MNNNFDEGTKGLLLIISIAVLAITLKHPVIVGIISIILIILINFPALFFLFLLIIGAILYNAL